jgi:mersacidin/lichenicidin family type 2 lantibiotic
MSEENIIRAWKDPDYCRELTEEQRAQVPAHPAGAIEFRIQGLDEALQRGVGHISPCHKCGSLGP